MLAMGSPTSGRTSTTCNTLLRELQQIWIVIGETEVDKDRMLLELERECLEVYRRKTQMEKKAASLKEQIAYVTPLVEDLKLKKEERVKQFVELKAQIDKITAEVSGYGHLVNAASSLNLEEQDLSLRKLTEYQTELQTLQKEKSERLHVVLEYVNEVHSLCGVLGLDFGKTVGDVHPSLHGTGVEQSTNISDSTLEGLERTVLKLKTERKVRFQKVVWILCLCCDLPCLYFWIKDLGKESKDIETLNDAMAHNEIQLKDTVASLSELWNLMGSTKEERSNFSRTTWIRGLSEMEISEPGVLSTENIDQLSAEVERLNKLKASRMKELVMKKRSELEDICHKTHIEPEPSTAPEKSTALIDSGLVDPCELLANIEAQISKTKDEALNRKEIMDKIERWLSACEEENWLEEYSQDHTRYSAGRGAHVNLKRAERARITVNKIPAIVDSLISKTHAWEDEKQKLFLYDGIRLVSILEDYKLARQQKEEEKRRYKDQKKLQDLLLIEKEAMYGSKPSPRRTSSFRKANVYHANGNGSMTPTPRRKSSGSPNAELLTPRSYSGHQNGYFKEMRRLNTAPLNFVAIAKEDTISFSSVCGSEPESPPQVRT
ncbi:hypothetical protein RHGRI_026549 [Rhododendron griersonianum]|uniref:65-kDa microtubule-associated protein 7 n=1 Tax=Rhododendron griersonianum TaxID=479676 RepID=A0AAV6ITE8_9ERIC|nr:hypothetical protein RHGRI_026549 [Rhododendron griersonianum]